MTDANDWSNRLYGNRKRQLQPQKSGYPYPFSHHQTQEHQQQQYQREQQRPQQRYQNPFQHQQHHHHHQQQQQRPRHHFRRPFPIQGRDRAAAGRFTEATTAGTTAAASAARSDTVVGMDEAESDKEFTGMTLVFLGTGGGGPSNQRGATAIALQLPRYVWLFDCGEGTQRQLHWYYTCTSYTYQTMLSVLQTYDCHSLCLCTCIVRCCVTGACFGYLFITTLNNIDV